MRTAAVALLLLLAACGGGSDPSDAKPETSKAPATTAAPSPAATTPAPVAAPTTPAGEPAPEALTQFLCQVEADGTWQATGVLANTTKSAVTFQVTIYIGEATGTKASATTEQVPSIAAGGSVPFTIDKIPPPAAVGPCHVQVLATK